MNPVQIEAEKILSRIWLTLRHGSLTMVSVCCHGSHSQERSQFSGSQFPGSSVWIGWAALRLVILRTTLLNKAPTPSTCRRLRSGRGQVLRVSCRGARRTRCRIVSAKLGALAWPLVRSGSCRGVPPSPRLSIVPARYFVMVGIVPPGLFQGRAGRGRARPGGDSHGP